MPTGPGPDINAAAPTGILHTLPAFNLAGTTDTGGLPFQGVVGGVPSPLGYGLINAVSTLTRPANTTAYSAAGSIFIASSTTAGSVVVPAISAARIATGAFMLRRCRLRTNATSGWGAVLQANFWTTAPTYTNGDAGAYAVATGTAGYIGSITFSLAQWGDGAMGIGTPNAGAEFGVDLVSGQNIFWDLLIISPIALTPISGQTFAMTAEIYQVT